jgi:hypothetical protein
MICGFQEYLVDKEFPQELLPLKSSLDTIPISSPECERGFLQMNLIDTPLRFSLLIYVSALLFIRIIGPTKYVQS